MADAVDPPPLGHLRTPMAGAAVKIMYYLLDGRRVYSPELSEERVALTLRQWRDAWESGERISGVLTFDNAVISSAAVISLEAPPDFAIEWRDWDPRLAKPEVWTTPPAEDRS